MEVIGYIILLALSGLVVGALARLLLIGPDPMSILETMLAGIGGSLIAGLIAYYVFDRNTGPGLILSVLCPMRIVHALRKYRQRAAPPRPPEPCGPSRACGGRSRTGPRAGPSPPRASSLPLPQSSGGSTPCPPTSPHRRSPGGRCRRTARPPSEGGRRDGQDVGLA